MQREKEQIHKREIQQLEEEYQNTYDYEILELKQENYHKQVEYEDKIQEYRKEIYKLSGIFDLKKNAVAELHNKILDLQNDMQSEKLKFSNE